MTLNKKIHVVTTGGTIEKTYDERDGTLANRDSVIREITAQLRLPFTELHFHALFAKDSLDMSEEDRRHLGEFIRSLLPLSDGIVVLHGTDTMAMSARHCNTVLSPVPKPIVFTGAMRPLGFEKSDARQNFTEALYAARLASPGVYISFHGVLHGAATADKDHATGTFRSI